MTQKQLDAASLEDFTDIQWERNQVTCQLQDRFSLVVKRYQREVYILLRSGTKVIKLPCDIFDAICNSHLSVSYLTKHLEQHEQEHKIAWLCCYCGASFMSEVDGSHHEERTHTEISDYCFHANLMDCEQCDKCGPEFRASMADF
jgi:hypothetical protein